MNNSVFGLALVALAIIGCDDFAGIEQSKRDGELYWHFAPGGTEVFSRADNLPDTNSFLFTVTDQKGNILYDGPYGASPEKLAVGQGNYTVEVRSCNFSKPEFSLPQWGDRQVVFVSSGERMDVALMCRMMNSGIRLSVSPSFQEVYPRGALYLRSNTGSLLYDYSEKRIAYFLPESVSLNLYEDGTESVLMTRYLQPCEVVSIGVQAVSRDRGGIRIGIDTTRTWVYDSLVIGDDEGDNGKTKEHPMSVSEAKTATGRKDVWVYGYIIGGDLTSSGSKMNIGPEFSKNTHLVIGARSSITEKTSGLSVELPKGNIRDALNLVDHPDHLGRMVILKGNLVESYFGIPGLKGVSDYCLK